MSMPDLLLDALLRAGPGDLLVDPAELLATLLARPEWHDRAACRSHPDPTIFFPERGHPGTMAKAVCAACPTRAECLDAAMNTNEHGIWGGTAGLERRRIRSGSAPAA